MTAHDERDRKAEHIQLSLDDRMQLHGHFFDAYYFEHEALPELDLQDVQISTYFLEKAIEAPLLISCMTGGTGDAVRINRHLAEAAEETGIALGVGSQRKALEDPSLVESFQVRRWAPSVPLLANLGAVQLNYGCGVKE
ncbi:MAG: type 2 isopentenyl-diphosphate Delta-isomerase, partial [Thermoanaerobaculia bacterium]